MYNKINEQNNLAVTHPALISEWHPTKNGSLTPQMVMHGSVKKVWWLGKCGHEWKSSISGRCQGRGCPYCAGITVLPGFNDLATVRPDIAAEWHPWKNGILTPKDVTAGSAKKVWWRCDRGHEWEISVNHRNLGSKCPICAGQVVLTGFNDLATVNPTLAAEWHPTRNGSLLPSLVTGKSDKKVWWLCDYGHEWQAKVNTRSRGAGCPICNKPQPRPLIVGKTDLATTHPHLIDEWHPQKNGSLTPYDFTSGSNRKVWWICRKNKNHIWQTDIKGRSKGRGCPYCARKYVMPGETDLATKNPALAAEWHPTKNGDLTPSMVLPGYNKKVWWLGKCGHEWKVEVSQRSLGRGCPICSGHRILAGFNDLATVNPLLAAEWNTEKNENLTPMDVAAGSNKKVWWKCKKCGHEWQAVINGRNHGANCPVCAKERK